MSSLLIPPITVPAPAAVEPLPASAVPEGPARRIVWKFGGTSVGNLDRIRAVAQRLAAAHRAGFQVVAVLSAMGNTTEELLALARSVSVAPPPRELDALLSLGESLSCSVATMAVHGLGLPAVSLNGSQAGVVTDDRHGNAGLLAVDPWRVVAELEVGRVVLVTGFQGVSTSGSVTTLGRGGSDASAIVLAAALGLGECDIFTDVPGVFTADPRVVPGARRLASVDHATMLRLADAGARVLQSRCVKLAAKSGVNIHVRSSATSETGTWIRSDSPASQAGTPVAVAHRLLDPVYRVTDAKWPGIAAALSRAELTPSGVMHSCREIQFTAGGAPAEAVLTAVHAAGGDSVEVDELGSVAVVFATDHGNAAATTRAIRALEDRAIRPSLVVNAPGRISCAFPTSAVEEAAHALHDAFRLHEHGDCRQDDNSLATEEATTNAA